ncbi:GNAT family N-acetyltransferase, partial [Salmonella sp. 3DZ2-4SM]
IFLAASTLGKPVYKKLGFKEVNEWMEINYDL